MAQPQRQVSDSAPEGPEVAAQKAAPRAQRVVEIPAALSVHELASLIGVEAIDVIKQLMRNGLMLTINDVVEHDAAALIVKAYGLQVKAASEQEERPGSLVIQTKDEDQAQLEPRPPVVTILGHVDHGKTTLLDAVRNSNLIADEPGGITQHIGAYQVDSNGNRITFLDTPGHEAFTAMRARGAQVTDVAVLVVAADDGIMPQTLEAIDHVKAAGVPMIAAINKVDRPDADPERVKRQLAENDLLVEEWGGDVAAVPVSALNGEGVSDLLENIIVIAEVSELKANPHQRAKGVVIEAQIDKNRGPVATVLVQTGTLEVGDVVVVGDVRGRVRAMFDDAGKRTGTAGPSVPVEIMGIDGLPEAGDIFEVEADERAARSVVEARQREKQRGRRGGVGVTLEEIYSRIESGEIKALTLIVKADAQGSIEPVRNTLEGLSTENARVNIIHMASGSITESDVLLAVASKAIIVGFGSHPEPGARTLASQQGVDIREYDVIYTLIDEVQKALQGLLAPVTREVREGHATVRATFNLGRSRVVAGIYVNDGRIARGAQIHVLRNDRQVFAGEMVSLKHFKDDVREIRVGLEGGVVLEGFEDFREGDVLEARRTEQVE